MKKFALYSDLIFTFFAATLVALCFFRYLDVTFILALLLGVLCGGLITLSLASFLFSRRKHRFLKKSDEEQKEKLLFHLALLSDEAKTEYFCDFFEKQAPDERPQRFSKLRIRTSSAFYFLHFSFAPVSADEIASFSRLKTGKRKILFCNRVEEDALALCRRLEIDVKTGEDVYTQLKSADFLPKRYLGEENANKKTKCRFKLWFAKANAKRFLISAVLLFILSQLTPFSFYYLVMGVILALASLFIRLFGYA